MAEFSSQIRKDLIGRLVEIPSVNASKFWSREMKITKELYEMYSDINFWKQLKFSYKLKSLAYLMSDLGKKELKTKWSIYLYSPNLIDDNFEIGQKVGKKYKKTNKKVTLMEFIDG